MKHGRAIAVGVLAAAIVAGIVIYALRPREPEYQGRRLSEWLPELDNWDSEPDLPAMIAIRQMGSSALPTLLKMIKHEDSPFKRKMADLAGRQSFIRFSFQTADTLHHRAAIGIYALGPEAKSAVPDLIALVTNQSPPISRLAPVFALSGIGPEAKEAVPFLLDNLKDEDYEMLHALSAYALGKIGGDARMAIPSLIPLLEDTDDLVRLGAVFALTRINPDAGLGMKPLVDGLISTNAQTRGWAASLLGELGSQAGEAIPVLEEALKDSEVGVQHQAAIALKKIDPASAAKAGAK